MISAETGEGTAPPSRETAQMYIENETHEALQKPFANSCTLEERGLRFECGGRSNLGIQVKVWSREYDQFGRSYFVIDGTYWIDPIRKNSRSVRPSDVLNAYHDRRW